MAVAETMMAMAETVAAVVEAEAEAETVAVIVTEETVAEAEVAADVKTPSGRSCSRASSRRSVVSSEHGSSRLRKPCGCSRRPSLARREG